MSEQELATQVKYLADSKYDEGETRWKAFNRFASSAVPAMVTFGIGAAAVTAVVTGAAALFFGGSFALGSVFAVGAGTAALAGGVTGVAASLHTSREIAARNEAIEKQIIVLKETALAQGTPILEKVVEPENPNLAKENPMIQNIIAQGKKTFSPVRIAQQFAEDAGISTPPR